MILVSTMRFLVLSWHGALRVRWQDFSTHFLRLRTRYERQRPSYFGLGIRRFLTQRWESRRTKLPFFRAQSLDLFMLFSNRSVILLSYSASAISLEFVIRTPARHKRSFDPCSNA